MFYCAAKKSNSIAHIVPDGLSMTEKITRIKELIESLSAEELNSLASYLREKLPRHSLEDKWDISHYLILDAIARSQDITQRGVRGVIAEAVFASDILPKVHGWSAIELKGDHPFDFKIQRLADHRELTIQVKLQRTEKGKPLSRKIFGHGNYIVEVQKTRSGTKRKSKEEASPAPEKTRPYKFGDFDILAVNMQPSTGLWTRFMYTVSSWLIPRAGDKSLIEIMQPVNSQRSNFWTDSINECIEWCLSAEKRLVFDIEAAKLKQLAEREMNKQKRPSKPRDQARMNR